MYANGLKIGKEEDTGNDMTALRSMRALKDTLNQSTASPIAPLALRSRYYIEYNSVENKIRKKSHDLRPL